MVNYCSHLFWSASIFVLPWVWMHCPEDPCLPGDFLPETCLHCHLCNLSLQVNSPFPSLFPQHFVDIDSCCDLRTSLSLPPFFFFQSSTLFLNYIVWLFFPFKKYLFIWLWTVYCGTFPDQGLNLGPLHWECRVLATGPPGKSLVLSILMWISLDKRLFSSVFACYVEDSS